MSKKSKGIIIGAGIGAAVLIAAAVIVIIMFSRGKSETYRVIKIMQAEGHSVISRGAISDLEAYVGMALQSGDLIHVDGNSSLVLMLDEDKLAYVEQNTDFELVAEGTSKDSRTRIELKRGAMTCEIQNSLSKDSFYEINTPNSTMAVRGTSFRVEVTDVETINEVLANSAIQPSMLFMAKTLEASNIPQMNTITRLTVTDGHVVVTLHDENGNKIGDEYEFDANTDILIGGNESDSRIIEEFKNIDLSTFPKVTIEFFKDISDGIGKMVISGDDLQDALEDFEGKPHMVTFMYNKKVFATQMVEDGMTAQEPQFMPTPKGSWDAKFDNPINTDTMFFWNAE